MLVTTKKMIQDINKLKKENKMGRIVEYAESFLERGGKDLGYDDSNMPEVKDFEVILKFHIPVWDYEGMERSEYYGKNKKGDTNEG